MYALRTILTAGFALFSMFFGSGNLVFPLNIGRESLAAYPYAIMGLTLTAVIVPILGFLGMILANGDRSAYFDKFGKRGTFTLVFLMLSLMGPIGAIPRCIGVAFGGVKLLLPSFDLWIFSLLFCLLIGFFVWSSDKVISIIGVIITPFKLGGILVLIIAGLYGITAQDLAYVDIKKSFILGVNQGYQTMDLLAGFFFGSTIINFIRHRLEANNNSISIKKLFLYGAFAGLLGLILLAIVYSGFVALGAYYGPQAACIPIECLLAHISGVAISPSAVFLVSFTLAISCLATATILTTLFAEFLQKDLLNNRMTYHQSVLITLLISFAASLFGFDYIVRWLGMFLSWMYPILIVYALYKIYDGLKKLRKASADSL